MYKEQAPRQVEKFVGIVLAVISVLIVLLILYSATVAYKNSAYSFTVLFIFIVFGFIGFSLGKLSARLISGKGYKRSKQLLSNTSLLIWGTIFGVAGIAEIIFAIRTDEFYILLLGIGTTTMGLGSYQLVKRRKAKGE